MFCNSLSKFLLNFFLKDQDYRTCPKDMKPSKLIRLGGVPETATKNDVSGYFLPEIYIALFSVAH